MDPSTDATLDTGVIPWYDHPWSVGNESNWSSTVAAFATCAAININKLVPNHIIFFIFPFLYF
jgi:hypothetical protein